MTITEKELQRAVEEALRKERQAKSKEATIIVIGLAVLAVVVTVIGTMNAYSSY